jgi:hypothetical protein
MGSSAEPGEPPEDASGEPLEEFSEEPPHAEEDHQGTHRALYSQKLESLPGESRARLAQVATEPHLTAFCYDPLPSVIAGLLDNTHVGLSHARLVALHHRNPAGLELLIARGQFATDPQLRAALLRNPQFQPAQYRRLWSSRPLLEQFKVVTSRELTEQTRRTARDVFRARFNTTAAEEKVDLIMKTEGRCLASLVGLSFDSKTAALLCARVYASTSLVQNLARFGACPPPLIAHLLRQELVRRSPNLRLLLERHPNAPKGRF